MGYTILEYYTQINQIHLRGDSYRGDRKILYPFDRGDRKINETHFARFFRPPPPVVNEPPLSIEAQCVATLLPLGDFHSAHPSIGVTPTKAITNIFVPVCRCLQYDGWVERGLISRYLKIVANSNHLLLIDHPVNNNRDRNRFYDLELLLGLMTLSVTALNLLTVVGEYLRCYRIFDCQLCARCTPHL